MEENEIEKAEPNRNRSRQVKFWVSEEEYELLQKSERPPVVSIKVHTSGKWFWMDISSIWTSRS